MEHGENSKVFLVYMTTPTQEEALTLARELVRLRLAAGVNIVPGAQSVYRWKGEVHEAGECLLVAQVSEAALPCFMAKARALHSYEVPCVVAMPIADGHQPFLRWITENSLPPTA
ncbi:divalent-cation tolerance protein CutA [Desulfovibrio desulfuricans]|uniref:divalent-cation tolerance protein CutA n=1 Tax=Desulfovibrio desulfuricans TaxID=876 RepID=UPI0003B5D9A7|nr:divalent-cation tolerance protein CutA [Desulfovibrio desulfuricans]